MSLSSKKISLIQSQLEEKRKSVSFDSYDISVRQVLDMVETGDIFVPPEYQRQFIWEPDRQSVLIESVFLGIPVPSLFMATNSDSTWEVVDGVQRLGSLSHFVGSDTLLEKAKRDKPLEIRGLEKLDTLNGATFQSLPKSIQLHFLTRPMRLTVLNDKSDLAVRFDLFERLNTGGVSLTPQEIRNCVYRGALNDSLKELSKDKNFHTAVKVQANKAKNGTYEELVLRFFAYLNNYQNFDHSVKDFLNDYMSDNCHTPVSMEDKKLFKKTAALLSEAFPNGISRGRGSTPANLYEALAVGVALALKESRPFTPEQLVPLVTDEKLKKFTGAGSNQKRFVIGRVEYVRDAL